MSLETSVMLLDWTFLDRYEPARFLDRMEDAGVRNVILAGSPPLVPDPANYVDSPVKPRPLPVHVLAYRSRVEALFVDARRRGLGIYAYGTCPHMSEPNDAYRELRQK